MEQDPGGCNFNLELVEIWEGVNKLSEFYKPAQENLRSALLCSQEVPSFRLSVQEPIQARCLKRLMELVSKHTQKDARSFDILAILPDSNSNIDD